MNKNILGDLSERYLLSLPDHIERIEIHNYVVMPNHIHILLQLLPLESHSDINSPVPDLSESINPVGTRHATSAYPDNINKGCLKQPRHASPRENDHFNSRLAVAIGSFKSTVTREYRKMISDRRTRHAASLPDEKIFLHNSNRTVEGKLPGIKQQIWQQRFYDIRINDQFSYDNIFNYIVTNPENWENDKFNLPLLSCR